MKWGGETNTWEQTCCWINKKYPPTNHSWKSQIQTSRMESQIVVLCREINLIKAVLTSIPMYSMGTHLLPKDTCKKLNALQRDIWWGFKEGEKHLYLKAWSHFQQEKARGSLGIREMEWVNKSLITKIGWRFL